MCVNRRGNYLRRMEWRMKSPRCSGDEPSCVTVQNCISLCSATLTAIGVVATGIVARRTRPASAEIGCCTVKSLDVMSIKHRSSGISVHKIPQRSKQITTGNNSRENLERKVSIRRYPTPALSLLHVLSDVLKGSCRCQSECSQRRRRTLKDRSSPYVCGSAGTTHTPSRCTAILFPIESPIETSHLGSED